MCTKLSSLHCALFAQIGSHRGRGFNINIALSSKTGSPMGDAEYLAVFRTIVLPLAKSFNPDMILISSGFSAASGHSPMLGGYKVSAQCESQYVLCIKFAVFYERDFA